MAEPTSLSLLLKRYRMVAGLSQEALAQRADLSARAISDLERGLHRAPHTATLELLASALALSSHQRAMLLAAARPELTSEIAAPGVATLAAHPRGLPASPTALVGREVEFARAVELLSHESVRLVTLVGPSGVGKTRLALQVARDLTATFGDGAVFVDLAPIQNPSLVPGAVAHALGLREQPDTPLDQQIHAHLGDRRVLLLLDNFEQVVASALFVADLLSWCPRVALLITSRTPLRLRGEHLLPLGPLPLEDAIVLFRERAYATRPGQPLAVSDMAAICERVDCLPLALELVASQVAMLSLSQIAEQLEQRLPLALEGARDLPARQRTMETAIGWSYDLLTPEQQRCFRAMGVFVGGATLEAARAVCWPDDAASDAEAFLALAAAVDASLVGAEIAPDGSTRFRLLELVRAYALDRLRAEGEEHDCRRRHATYYASLLDRKSATGTMPQTPDAPPVRELTNARAAIEWAAQQREAALALQVAGYWRMWSQRGQTGEGEHWLSETLALDAEARAAGAPVAPLLMRVERLYSFARALLNRGNLERAGIMAQESVSLAREVGDPGALSNAYATVGMVAQARGDIEQATAAFTESVAFVDPDEPHEASYRALSHLAELARYQGDLDRAHALLERARAGAEAAENAWDSAIMTTLLAHLERQQREYARARPRYLESLRHFLAFENSNFFAWCLEGYCALLSAEGDYAIATRLCAAAATLRLQEQAPLPTAERAAFERMLASARAALGDRVYEAEWQAGSSYTASQALVAALKSG